MIVGVYGVSLCLLMPSVPSIGGFGELGEIERVHASLQRYAGECRETCQFLRRVNSIRPGRCPPETQATGFAALCVTACDTDADCDPGALKCCSNSCGWTCQQAMHMFDGNAHSHVISSLPILTLAKNEQSLFRVVKYTTVIIQEIK